MKSLFRALIACTLLIFLASDDLQAGTKHLPDSTYVEKIVEIDPGYQFLQVGNYSFTIGAVFQDDGSGETPANRHDLREGQLVRVEVGRKGKDVSEASKIVILQGARREEALRGMQLPPMD